MIILFWNSECDEFILRWPHLHISKEEQNCSTKKIKKKLLEKSFLLDLCKFFKTNKFGDDNEIRSDGPKCLGEIFLFEISII